MLGEREKNRPFVHRQTHTHRDKRKRESERGTRAVNTCLYRVYTYIYPDALAATFLLSTRMAGGTSSYPLRSARDSKKRPKNRTTDLYTPPPPPPPPLDEATSLYTISVIHPSVSFSKSVNKERNALRHGITYTYSIVCVRCLSALLWRRIKSRYCGIFVRGRVIRFARLRYITRDSIGPSNPK